MPLPALLTIQSGISKLRYATLMGIKKAKSKEIKRRVTAESLGVARRPRHRARAHLSAASAPSTRNSSRAAPRKRPPNWWRN